MGRRLQSGGISGHAGYSRERERISSDIE